MRTDRRSFAKASWRVSHLDEKVPELEAEISRLSSKVSLPIKYTLSRIANQRAARRRMAAAGWSRVTVHVPPGQEALGKLGSEIRFLGSIMA